MHDRKDTFGDAVKKPESACLITHALAGPCAECDIYQTNCVHVVANRLLCADHCPEHGMRSHDLEMVAVPAGEQLGLL